MSFRSTAIRRHRFDETLSEYGLNEDVDASFSAWREGLVVADWDAQVYHHKSPEPRSGGYRLGVTASINRAYVVAKHTPLDHPARTAFEQYANYCSAVCRFQRRSEYMREKARGLDAARTHAASLLTATPPNLQTRYRAAIDDLLRASPNFPTAFASERSQ